MRRDDLLPGGSALSEGYEALGVQFGYGVLVPGAELLIGLRGIEDQPGDLVHERADVHYAVFP